MKNASKLKVLKGINTKSLDDESIDLAGNRSDGAKGSTDWIPSMDENPGLCLNIILGWTGSNLNTIISLRKVNFIFVTSFDSPSEGSSSSSSQIFGKTFSFIWKDFGWFVYPLKSFRCFTTVKQ